MRALVTGATGFVGSHVADLLVDRGHEVTALIRSPAKAARLAERGVRLVQGDLGERSALEQAVDGQEVIFHVAGLVKALDEADYLRVNEAGTRELLSAAIRAGSARFVLVSSLAAAGPSVPGQPLRGGEPERPVTAYGRSKLAAERVVTSGPLPWTVVRPPLVYGPRDVEFLPVFRMARRGFGAVFGSGRQELSAVYAGDLAEALLAVARNVASVGHRYYPCHAERFRSVEFVRAVGRALDRKLRVVPIPAWATRLTLRSIGAAARLAGRATVLNADKANEFLAPAWTADPGALSRDTGWCAAHDLGHGLAETAVWYRGRGLL